MESIFKFNVLQTNPALCALFAGFVFKKNSELGFPIKLYFALSEPKLLSNHNYPALLSWALL